MKLKTGLGSVWQEADERWVEARMEIFSFWAEAGTVMFISQDVIGGPMGALLVLEIVNASDLRDRRVCVY